MQPVVNRLEVEFGDRVHFAALDVRSADGGQWFRRLGLPGHPSIVLLLPDGTEVLRAFGITDEATLRRAVEDMLRLGEVTQEAAP